MWPQHLIPLIIIWRESPRMHLTQRDNTAEADRVQTMKYMLTHLRQCLDRISVCILSFHSYSKCIILFWFKYMKTWNAKLLLVRDSLDDAVHCCLMLDTVHELNERVDTWNNECFVYASGEENVWSKSYQTCLRYGWRSLNLHIQSLEICLLTESTLIGFFYPVSYRNKSSSKGYLMWHLSSSTKARKPSIRQSMALCSRSVSIALSHRKETLLI